MFAGIEPLGFGYVGLFLLAGLGSAVGGLRACRIDHPDTRRGLVGLLTISSGWALVQGVTTPAPWKSGSGRHRPRPIA